ncbi:MAG: thioesterase family protein [Acidimicrobiales bacterium]
MDATDFLGLQPTHNPHRFVLPIVPGLATAGRFLFGGCGLGAAICALEQATGRPVVWATGQYLSYAMVGETMDVDVTIATSGHFTTQARVVAHVADREILTVNAALGARPLEFSGQWEQMPEVPRPDECERRASRWEVRDTIMERMDVRLAKGRQWEELDASATPSADGTSALWIRMADLAPSAAMLAVLGDYVPFGIAQALGRWTRANSLDNTLRIVQIVPTEWVLLDIRIHGVRDGFGHGLVHLWAEDGTLLATASQSAIVRELESSAGG